MKRLAPKQRPPRAAGSWRHGRRWLVICLSLLLAVFLAADDPDAADTPDAGLPHADASNVGDPNVGDPNVGDPNVGDPNVGEQNVGEQNVGEQEEAAAGSDPVAPRLPGEQAVAEPGPKFGDGVGPQGEPNEPERDKSKDGSATDERTADERAKDSRGNDSRDSAPSAMRRAYLVPVRLPITGEEDTRLKRAIDRLVSELPPQGPRPVLILEFRETPDQPADSSQFERSLSLARYLAGPRMSRVETVAYLPGDARGHAVLVAMACEGLVASADSELGAAGIGEEFIDPTLRRGYAEIAGRRRTIPEAVALGMLDRQLAVYRVDTLDGVRYVLGDELEVLRNQGAFSEAETISPAGDFVTLRGDRLRELGFASHLAGDRAELAAALELPATAIEEDPSLVTGWQAVRVDLRGRVTAGQVNQILRGIQDAQRRDQVNFICLWVDSPGGSPADSVRLANALADLDGSRIRTVAFVSGQARGDAILPVWACDHTILEENSVLGGPGDHHLPPGELDDLRGPVQQLARSKGRDWSLPLGLLDSRLAVYRYRQEGTGQERFLCQEEAADRPGWQRGDKQDLARGVLAREAESLGLARAVPSPRRWRLLGCSRRWSGWRRSPGSLARCCSSPSLP